MALVAVDSAPGALVEFDAGAFGGSPETLDRLLESQRELFHAQIGQLQLLVAVQCKLTGVNPLAQEMAAGALSIKIGKRPRDLLNPKAVKYMQSVFSIKDTIGKKETREISALCGVTVSQVREYFSGQRSRVRKLVRLSREKATRSEASKPVHEKCIPHLNNSLPGEATIAAENMLIVDNAQIPVKAGIPQIIGTLQLPVNISILSTAENIFISGNADILATSKNNQEDIVASSDLKKVEETHLSSLQEETVPGIDFDDKKFIDDIFNLMEKENTFSGQVKLMEWILRIQNTAVLNWFLTKGGLTILATWLSQLAVEEQTSMIHLILKVFCHLPLQKALPVQMSTILQAVNKLRFYRFSDISQRAKVLLSRWSKQLIRSQALKKPFNSSSRTARKDLVGKQRLGDVLFDESWQSKVEFPEDILYLTGNSGSNRISEPKQELKLLPAPGDDASKKYARVVSLAKSKERRKVLLVEQPDRRSSGRTAQVARVVPLNHSRPISADDIQKAKLRAMFMQDKYRKTDATNSGNKLEKKDVHMVPASITPEVQPLINEDDQQRVSITDSVPNVTEAAIDSKQSSSSTLQLDKLSCCKIQWQNPPAVRICSQWCVAVGEKSKEVEVQTQRNKREKETFYSCPQEIPLDPKEPWDFEMDFDDSLTPEIPIEQPPEADVSDGPSCSPHDSGCATTEEPREATLAPLSTIMTPTSTQLPNSGASQPDMELLAVLLKNPDLVLALTSNQGKTLTSDEMVALLDMLKSNGNPLAGLMNGTAQTMTDTSSQDVRQYEPEPTSLPSPTPPSDIARMAWRSQFPNSRAQVLQPFSGTGASTSIVSQPPVPSLPEAVQTRSHSLVLPQAPATMLSTPQSAISNIPTLQNHSAFNALTNRHPLPSAPLQSTPSIYSMHRTVSSEYSLPTRHLPVSDPSLTAELPRQEFFAGSSSSLSTHQTSVPHPASLKSQMTTMLPEPPKFAPQATAWSATTVNAANASSFLQRETTPDQWINRSNRLVDGSASNQHFFSNQNNYNAYSHAPTPPPSSLSVHSADTSRRIADGSRSAETWSSDNDRGRSRDSRGEWNRGDPPRRDNGWNDKPEWSRQWVHGDRDHHHRSGGSGRRWRERDYGRRR